MLGAFDFSPAKFNVSNMKIWEVILTSIELMCLGGSLIVIVGATIYLLFLLRGRRIAVFKSEDIRNEEIYRNKESHAALWLIDKYTRIVNEVRPIVQKKQKAFDNAMVAIIVGIMMYVVAVLLEKEDFEVPNRDKTMDDIKNGKGLPQLSSAEGSNHQTGITTEQRAEKGITYEIFTHHGEKRSNREQ